VAGGIVQHLRDDEHFHGTRAFAETSLQLTVAVRDALDGETGLRPAFLAHLLVELLLDAALITDNPDRLSEYYRVLEGIEAARRAGFGEVHLELQARIAPPEGPADWESFLRIAGNPKIPTLAEAMQQVLTPEEIERFTAKLRPLVESRKGLQRRALAYLWAVKSQCA
jgi:hypothetical protein